jgi:septal ring factor EnvC (AmiA/AmiB activator)
MYVAIVAVLGLAGSFIIVSYVFYGVNVLSGLPGLITLASEKITGFITWGSQNVVQLIATLAPFATGFTLLANWLHKRYKSTQNVEMNNIKQELLTSGSENFKLTQTLQERDNELSKVTGELEAFKSGTNDISALQSSIHSLNQTNDKIRVERENFRSMYESTLAEKVKLEEKLNLKVL